MDKTMDKETNALSGKEKTSALLKFFNINTKLEIKDVKECLERLEKVMQSKTTKNTDLADSSRSKDKETWQRKAIKSHSPIRYPSNANELDSSKEASPVLSKSLSSEDKISDSAMITNEDNKKKQEVTKYQDSRKIDNKREAGPVVPKSLSSKNKISDSMMSFTNEDKRKRREVRKYQHSWEIDDKRGASPVFPKSLSSKNKSDSMPSFTHEDTRKRRKVRKYRDSWEIANAHLRDRLGSWQATARRPPSPPTFAASTLRRKSRREPAVTRSPSARNIMSDEEMSFRNEENRERRRPGAMKHREKWNVVSKSPSVRSIMSDEDMSFRNDENRERRRPEAMKHRNKWNAFSKSPSAQNILSDEEMSFTSENRESRRREVMKHQEKCKIASSHVRDRVGTSHRRSKRSPSPPATPPAGLKELRGRVRRELVASRFLSSPDTVKRNKSTKSDADDPMDKRNGIKKANNTEINLDTDCPVETVEEVNIADDEEICNPLPSKNASPASSTKRRSLEKNSESKRRKMTVAEYSMFKRNEPEASTTCESDLNPDAEEFTPSDFSQVRSRRIYINPHFLARRMFSPMSLFPLPYYSANNVCLPAVYMNSDLHRMPPAFYPPVNPCLRDEDELPPIEYSLRIPTHVRPRQCRERRFRLCEYEQDSYKPRQFSHDSEDGFEK